MNIWRKDAKRDRNEGEVVSVLAAHGCLVERISGAGVPDLLCWHPASGIFLVEVKDGARKGAVRLKPAQVAFHARWKGAPIYVVTSTADGLALMRQLGLMQEVSDDKG